MIRQHNAAKVGAAIRKLRLARGLNLAALSAQSGIPISTLSRAELGQSALRHEKLMRICRALEVDIGGLAAPEPQGGGSASGRRSVARAGEGPAIDLEGARGRLAADDILARRLSPVVLDVEAPPADPDRPPALTVLGGEAYLFVLAGTLQLHTPHYAPLSLRPGDGVYFDGAAGYAVTAEEAPARALLVVAGDAPFGPG